MGVNHYARRGCFLKMCHEPWSFRLLLFLCANGYTHSRYFILLIKNCWKAVFFYFEILLLFSNRDWFESRDVTSISQSVFALKRFWLIVGSETNIPDDSFGGYEIAPPSQILYLDIQTLQPPWNIFNMRKYKRHNIISHDFIIKNT